MPTTSPRNELTIVVKPGNPKNVKSLADLADLDVVSSARRRVPCGKYAAQALHAARRDHPAGEDHPGRRREGDARRGRHR